MPDPNQSGLSDNAAGALAYFTFIPAIIFLIVAPFNTNSYVRFHSWQSILLNVVAFCINIVLGIVLSIGLFFLIYWLLPNRKVPWRPVLRTAIVTGVIWLCSKYAFEALLPHLALEDLYGQFYVSVGLLFWAYASGLILFAGAQFSVSRLGDKKEPKRRRQDDESN